MMVMKLIQRGILFLVFCLFGSAINAQVEKDPSKIYFINLEALITEQVKEKMQAWTIQDEFETSNEYKARMRQKDEMIKQFTEEAKNYYMMDFVSKVDFRDYQISKYDADRQSFKITVGIIGDFILPVDRTYARGFKESALTGGLRFENPDFVIRNNSWQLSYLDVVCEERSYSFNIRNQVGYNPADDFLVEAEDLNISIDLNDRRNSYSNVLYDDRSFEDIDPGYDVNTNLPINTQRDAKSDAVAVIIGNRNYQNTKNVDYAIRDAVKMKQYLVEVLGFRSGNVLMVRNASKGQFETLFGTDQDHRGQLFDLVRAGKSDVFVFYSGHGAPGLNNKKGYFVPVECNPKKVELAGYPLDLFYTNLKKIPSKSTTVVLDACFSGADILEGISPIGIRIRSVSNNDAKTVVLASSSETEVSTWYHAKKHGMFTYYFLKAIHDKENSDRDRDGNVTFTEIYNYIFDKVQYGARRLHGIDQTPTLMGGNKEGILFQYQ